MRNLYQEFRKHAEDYGGDTKDELFEALVWFVYDLDPAALKEGELHQTL